ncbi:MAG: tRNA (guanosine(37)-N1)-methyltransferase TrmD [Alphaproteobacteria bacterium]|nr:tRNA (guanosine(37)-N1)-methyltransferase TrmD [Alphaproteobacteria bacterium]
MTFKANILTLFPEMFEALKHSITGRAIGEGKLALNLINIRDFAEGNYKAVDDAPYGGGAGQVMRADVLGRAIDSVGGAAPIFYLSPRGEKFSQKMAEEWARLGEATFICGHYEGIDERVLEYYGAREISLGDFVVSGGEVAILPMLDAVSRLVDGVLGAKESLDDESFSASLDGGLEYPQYTRPEEWRGLRVPEVLTSGHHKNIEKWRREKSEELTAERRPDLKDFK